MNKMRYFVGLLGLLLLVVFSATHSNASEGEPEANCLSAREFITTHRYLKNRDDLGLNKKQTNEIAHKVSLGCSGSAKRFIYSLEILLKAEAAPRGAMQAAISLSQKSQSYTHTFLGVFKHSYLSKYLDMNFKAAFQLAESLSTDYEGDVNQALKDFYQVAEYCIEEKDISLTKSECGLLAGRVAKYGEHTEKPLAKAFIRAYEFIQSSKGPQIPINSALKVAEDIVKVSPHAVTNFIQAYRYGISDKGMKLTNVDSLRFAQKITNRTVHNPDIPFKIDYNRLPASLKKPKKN